MKRSIGQKSTSHEFTIWFHAAITAEIVSGRRYLYGAALSDMDDAIQVGV